MVHHNSTLDRRIGAIFSVFIQLLKCYKMVIKYDGKKSVLDIFSIADYEKPYSMYSVVHHSLTMNSRTGAIFVCIYTTFDELRNDNKI